MTPKLSPFEQIKWQRSDLSFFLVHLTKNGPDIGLEAKNVLEEILTPNQRGECTLHGSPQGLFAGHTGIDKKLVTGVSLTEAPLDQIKHFAKPLLDDSSRNYSKYGLVFDEEFIRKKGGNPCFYVNTIAGDELKKAVLCLGDVPEGPDKKDLMKLLLFFNIFGKSGPTGASGSRKEIDFYWEREWRVPGNLVFRHEDVFVGLCDHDCADTFSRKYSIPFICPDWNYDRILTELRNWFPRIKSTA